MPCVHLKQLIQLCEEHHLKVAGSDVVHLVCEQCGQQEVCPDMMIDEYEARENSESAPETSEAKESQR